MCSVRFSYERDLVDCNIGNGCGDAAAGSFSRNIANANSDGPLPSADASIRRQYNAVYLPQRVDQIETAGGGTMANVNDVSPGYTATYDPTAPYADDEGMVASPNVDMANEAVQQLIARYTFAMNVMVVRTYQHMMKSLLDIKT